jgi:PAS domain S-box-containing protein
MSDASTWSRERVRLQDEEAKIRLVVLLFVTTLVCVQRSIVASHEAVAMGLALMATVLALSWFGVRRQRLRSADDSNLIAVITAVIDLAAVSLVVRGTGGFTSDLFPLYLLCLIFAAAFFRRLELAFLTLMACLFYSSVVIGGEVTPALISHLSMRLGAIVVVAWFSYVLAAALHGAKQANDQLLRHLAEGVMVLDEHGRIATVNPTFCSMFGVQSSELLGLSAEELGKARGPLGWVVADVAEGEPGGVHTVRTGYFPEAELPVLEISTIPCSTNDGHPTGWVLVSRDLRDAAGRSPVDSRGICDSLSPLANLRALTEALYDLADNLDDDERVKALSLVEEHSQGLKSLLSDLLRSRAEIGAPYLGLQMVDPAGILTSTRRLLSIQTKAQNVGIEVRCPDNLPVIQADRGQLGKCILHVCRSLFDAARPGDYVTLEARVQGPEIVFTFGTTPAVRSDRDTRAIGQAVRDVDAIEAVLRDSMGKVSQVIEAHSGSWSTTHRKDGYCGVAISLPADGAMVRPAEREGMVMKDGGGGRAIRIGSRSVTATLSAASINNLNNILSAIRGYAELALSTQEEERIARALSQAIDLSDQAAELTSALAAEAADVPYVPHSTANRGEPGPRPVEPVGHGAGGGAQAGPILIVDDQEAIRSLLADLLRAHTLDVEVAADGETAINMLDEVRPRLIFVDLLMPGVGGIQVLQAARERCPGTPVIVMSGSGAASVEEALGSERPFAVLHKPFTMEEVIALTRRAAEAASTRPSSGST